MKSSYDSAEHQRIRETREALRAHAIDQNNTGRTPERVIDILTTHGCTRSSALVLMENIFTGDLTVTQRGIIREISKKSPDTIPPVIPPQKPEEPKRVVKHTPLWEPTVPQVSLKRIVRGAPASTPYSDEGGIPRSDRNRNQLEQAIPPGHVRVNPETLLPTDSRGIGIVMSEKTRHEIACIREFGHLTIEKISDNIYRFQFRNPKDMGSFSFQRGLVEGMEVMKDHLIQSGKIRADFTDETAEVTIDPESCFRTIKAGITIKQEAWKKLKRIREVGSVLIVPDSGLGENALKIIFTHHTIFNLDLNHSGDVEKGIDRLLRELESRRAISQSSETSTTKIKFDVHLLEPTTGYIDMVEITPETLEKINNLHRRGDFTIAKHTRSGNVCTMSFFDYASKRTREYSGRLDEIIIELEEDLGMTPRGPGTQISGQRDLSETKTLESVPTGYVLMDLKMLTRTAARMNAIVVKEETLEEIKFLKLHGTLELDDLGNGNLYMKFNSEKSHMNRPVMATELSDVIAELVAEIKKLESPQPSTVRIYLSPLMLCDSKNPDEGVEVSSLTWKEIQELQKIGTLTITKSWETGYFRCRLAGKVGGGGPWVGTNRKLEYAIAVLIDQLRHAGKYPANPEQTETPADTVNIDITDVRKCTNTGPGVVTIARKTWEDMKKLKYVGRLEISPTNAPDKFTIIYSDHRDHMDQELLRVDLEEGIARLMQEARGYYAEEFEEVETPADTVKIDIDDVQECTGTGPGVVSIHPKTWEDIKTLNQIGRFQIFAEEKEGLFTVNFHDPLQYATTTDFRGSIEEAVARILKNAQNCGYYDHIIGNKYGYRGPDILDD